MADPRLLIPFLDLPGPVPAGSPADKGRIIIVYLPDGEYGPHYLLSQSGEVLRAKAPDILQPCDIALDLSPPPIVDGHPTRIDGAQVAAAMLARTAGLDTTGGVNWSCEFDNIDTTDVLILAANHEPPENNVVAFTVKEKFDPTDPLAPRLALAEALNDQLITREA